MKHTYKIALTIVMANMIITPSGIYFFILFNLDICKNTPPSKNINLKASNNYRLFKFSAFAKYRFITFFISFGIQAVKLFFASNVIL